MTDALQHRGPDSRGHYQWTVGDTTVFVGHRRLSIVDLSAAGSQPMVTDDDAIAISYNGEIYNFEDLRAQYLRHQAFRSRTDTEVLLHLYRLIGRTFVDQLNGDFAIAILDKRSAELHLYRDRLGIKPLYVYDANGVFAFSSEIKSFAAAGLPLTVSETAFQQYLVFKYVPLQQTLHQEVTRVAPGTYLSIDLGSCRRRVTRYWTRRHDSGIARLSFGDARDRLRELVGDAVRRRLMGDVPIGTFLSGGLDSSIIAYHLRDRVRIRHYCARKADLDLRREGTTSDFDHASRLARRWNLPFTPIDIGDTEATPELVQLTSYYADDLIADGSQIPAYLICRQASAESRVILSGVGADELFYGYAGHVLSLIAVYFDRLPTPVARGIAGFFDGIDSGRGRLLAYRRWLRKFGRYYAHPSLRYSGFTIVGDIGHALDVCALDPANVTDLIERAFPPDRDPFESLTEFELDNFLVKNLHYLDRMAMASSVEARVPYLDHRIVEFALSLRREFKLSRFGETKRILKAAFRRAVPAHVRYRRKAGFGMPLRSIMRNPQKTRALIDIDRLASVPTLRVDRLPRLIDSHAAGVEDNSALLYALISFQEWSKVQSGGVIPVAARHPLAALAV